MADISPALRSHLFNLVCWGHRIHNTHSRTVFSTHVRTDRIDNLGNLRSRCPSRTVAARDSDNAERLAYVEAAVLVQRDDRRTIVRVVREVEGNVVDALGERRVVGAHERDVPEMWLLLVREVHVHVRHVRDELELLRERLDVSH